MDSLHFIVNPVAGSGLGERCFYEAKQILDERHIEFSYAFSQQAGESVELAKKALADGEKRVIAVGGDGTIHEVAGILAGTACVMGILPAGSGNDLCKAIGIPTKTKDALEIILAGSVRKMDAGRVNKKLFFNAAGIGFDVDVLIHTERYKRHLNGMLPYMLGLIGALKGLKADKLTITKDGEVMAVESILLCVANGTHFGGGMRVAPNADAFDGLFDVCVVDKIPMPKFLALLPGFVKGKHIDKSCVDMSRARELYVESAVPAMIELDGEIVEATPATITLLPGALNLIVRA